MVFTFCCFGNELWWYYEKERVAIINRDLFGLMVAVWKLQLEKVKI